MILRIIILSVTVCHLSSPNFRLFLLHRKETDTRDNSVGTRCLLRLNTARLAIRGSSLDIGGGGGAGVFAWPFLFISQGRLKALIFHLRIG